MEEQPHEQQMESSIVEGFQNLQVLAAYDFQKMNQLVQELTNLDSVRSQGNGKNGEQSSPGTGRGSGARKTNKKKRCRKRKSAPGMVWQVHPEIGNMSEASESSLDEALKDYIENIAQQSDSDELIRSAKRLPSLSFPHHATTLVESDSFTENFSPMRPQRRKKRFTRMAVDPHDENELPISECQGELHGDSNTLGRNKPESSDEKTDTMDTDKIGDGKTCSLSVDTLTGKRKRCVKDKSSNNSFDLEQIGDAESNELDSHDKTKTAGSSPGDSCSSVLSSSGESEGIFTNDEGRDGDDEQSDFFHEPGPTSGVPGIVPWWESEAQAQLEAVDPDFKRILNGAFEYMSPISQRNFRTRLKLISKTGREIRSGRRRLKDRRPGYSLTRFLQDRQQWCEATKKFCVTPSQGCGGGNGSNGQSSGNNGNNRSGADTKRRRKTPPASEGEFVGGDADPIPDSNIGNQLLQSMGWTPGTGLGAEGVGITTPVMAFRRPGRTGLGSSGQNS